MSPTPNEQDAMKDIERLVTDLEHRARWWRQDGLVGMPITQDTPELFAAELDAAVAAIRRLSGQQEGK